MAKHTISHADQLYWGAGYKPGANASVRGIPMNPVIYANLGRPDAKSANSVATAQTPAGAGNLTLDGVLVANGVATLDVPRNVSITGVAATTAANFTVTGKDQYGDAMTEVIAGPVGANVVTGKKAFSTISQIAVDAGTTGNVSVGHDDSLGLPYLLRKDSKCIFFIDGVIQTTGTVTIGDVTDPATSSTGDVRGTFLPGSAPDGLKQMAVWLIDTPNEVANDSIKSPYGLKQA